MTAPTFRKVVSGLGQGEEVVPLLRAALWDPDFKSFGVKVEGFKQRPPDGWFHPSTHPLWTEVMLYLYLTNYRDMIREPLDPTSTLAVTAGSFFHTFIQSVLLREKVLMKFSACPCGHGHQHSQAEVYLVDEDTRSRGHSDGLLYSGSGFEFKTMNTQKMWGIPRSRPDSIEILDWFKERCPDYYGQAQEYLRLGGQDKMVVIILSLSYPFEMREIHVPFDKAWSYGVAEKFKRAIQAAADHRRPRCQCDPRNTTCPARGVCHFD